ncbi:MAG: leucine-rich repeat protein [Ruminiclostridium sp.]|nr:leucine-rich repeat protein [Ruminiclostridium sp.]
MNKDRLPGRPCKYCFSEISADSCCPDCAGYVAAAHHLPAGNVLAGRYTVGRVIGEGGFGIIYLGYDERLALRVAIKEFYPRSIAKRSLSSTDVFTETVSDSKRLDHEKKRFLREARTAAQLGGRVIVGVRDYFEENNTAYFVMEYVNGVTLKALSEKHGGRIPADELFKITEPLYAALSELHTKGFIHGDISPDNIMITDGTTNLLDFGSARDSSEWDKTATSFVTKDFTPIEQYRSKGQGPWTDIYSLAATLYCCLTGIPPTSVLERLAGDKLPAPSASGVNISAAQEKALMKALSVRSGGRFKTAAEMYEALYKKELPDAGSSGRRKIKTAAVIAAAVLAVTLAGGALVYGILAATTETVIYTVPESFHYYVTADGAVIDRYTGNDTEIYVPPELDGYTVTEFDATSFDLERFEELQRESIETGEFADFGGIGVYPFPSDDIHWNISKVAFSKGLKELGNFTFTECRSLKTVVLPEGTERIGIMCFNMCDSLEELHLPDSIREIGDYAFNCAVIKGRLELPASLNEISPMTFRQASLDALTIPNGVTAIGEYAFDGCYFASENASLEIPDSVTDIGKGAFRFCQSLCHVTLPKKLTVIKKGVFEGCGSLDGVIIPEGVGVIEERAFAYCTSLKKLTIPDSVKEIRSAAFEGCLMLKSVSIPAGCVIADDAFGEEPVYIEYR